MSAIRRSFSLKTVRFSTKNNTKNTFYMSAIRGLLHKFRNYFRELRYCEQKFLFLRKLVAQRIMAFGLRP